MGYRPWGHKDHDHVYVHIFSVFIHPSRTHLGCYLVLAVVNSTAVNTEVQISLQYPDFLSCREILRASLGAQL